MADYVIRRSRVVRTLLVAVRLSRVIKNWNIV